MTKLHNVVGALVGCVLFGALLPSSHAGTTATCVGVSSHAVYRNYGYDHIVHLSNHCDAARTCAVSTDVNPDATEVTVAAKGEADVLTFRGSPASAFTPHVSCRSAS